MNTYRKMEPCEIVLTCVTRYFSLYHWLIHADTSRANLLEARAHFLRCYSFVVRKVELDVTHYRVYSNPIFIDQGIVRVYDSSVFLRFLRVFGCFLTWIEVSDPLLFQFATSAVSNFNFCRIVCDYLQRYCSGSLVHLTVNKMSYFHLTRSFPELLTLTFTHRDSSFPMNFLDLFPSLRCAVFPAMVMPLQLLTMSSSLRSLELVHDSFDHETLKKILSHHTELHFLTLFLPFDFNFDSLFRILFDLPLLDGLTLHARYYFDDDYTVPIRSAFQLSFLSELHFFGKFSSISFLNVSNLLIVELGIEAFEPHDLILIHLDRFVNVHHLTLSFHDDVDINFISSYLRINLLYLEHLTINGVLYNVN